MSSLRARCPDCRTFTAVALGDGYECHRCGRTFGAGLVRVPRAWGSGGEAMAEGARLAVPYPEVGVVEEETLAAQSDALAEMLSARPVVLGGCCCAHVGAARGLADRVDRLGIVWIDAHGDLNTPETSPSGNLWGMPLRMLLDDGVVRHADVALVGARNLDPPESEFMARTGIDDPSSARSRASTLRMSRSTWTFSTLPRPTSSWPNRTALGSTSSKRFCAGRARARKSPAWGSRAFARASATSPWSRGFWALQASSPCA